MASAKASGSAGIGSKASLLKKDTYSQHTGPLVSRLRSAPANCTASGRSSTAIRTRSASGNSPTACDSGKSIWWQANGQKLREIDFIAGEVDGHVRLWDKNNNLVADDTYQGGRRLAVKTDYYPNGQVRTEGMYLFARDIMTTNDDWWTMKMATYAKQGKDVKHGAWTAWYVNGQKQSTGEYRDDQPVGHFAWWHNNGQRRTDGAYENGVQHGKWTWWHENGQKSAQGYYDSGERSGKWLAWQSDGKVIETMEMPEPQAAVVDQPHIARVPDHLAPPRAGASRPIRR